jgi:hypothetical protein
MLTLICASAFISSAQQNEVKWNYPEGAHTPGITHQVLRSKSMDLDVGYNVYLPPGYASGSARYPVV